MPHSQSTLTKEQRREWWWLALVGLLLGSVLVLDLWQERQKVYERERRLLEQQAGVLHDNLGAELEGVNHALNSLLVDLNRGHGEVDGSGRLGTRLRGFANAMPAVRTLSLLDVHGRVLASSQPEYVGRDLSERPYFQAALHARQAGTLFVGRPVIGVLGDWVLSLGRIVLRADGQFGGMLVASLDARHFHPLLQSVRYAPDMRVALIHGDGLRFMLLGADHEREGVDMARPGSLLAPLMAAGVPSAVLQGPPQPGLPEHLMALRTVQPRTLRMDKPLVVAVGRPLEAVYADWQAQARTLALALLLAAVAAALGLWALQRRQGQLNARAQRLEAEQRRQQDMLRRLAENLPGLLFQFQLEPDGRSHYPYASPGVADIYGFTPEQLQADAAPVFSRTHPDDLPQRMRHIQESARTLADWKSEYRVTLPGRGERWLSGQARPQRLEGGAVLWHGYIQDITEAKRQALQLQETERVLQHLMNEMPIGLCMVDAAHRIYFRNRRFLQDFGHAETSAPTLHEWSLQAYPDAAYRQQVGQVWKEAVAQALQGDGQIPERDYRITAQDGTPRTVAIGGMVFGGHFLATFVDRTEQQAQSERLRTLAYMDGLTGIANRRLFDQQLQAEWRRCRRSGKPLALVLLDIDYFKQFNDLYGHQRGDECLRTVADTLRGQLGRSHDLLARYGGEEFVCLLPECDLAGATQKAQALCQAVRALGIAHGGSAVAEVLTISLGVACQVPDGASSPADLLARADAYLYRAKSQGRGRVDDGAAGLLK